MAHEKTGAAAQPPRAAAPVFSCVVARTTRQGFNALSNTRITDGVWFVDVAARDPAVAPGNTTAVNTEPDT